MSCVRRHVDALVRRCETIVSEGVKKRWGRPKITWRKVVAKHLQILGINEDLAKDTTQRKKRFI